MKFGSLYRISFYTMLFLATLTLNLDAGNDNPLSVLYAPAVALAGIVAFLTVDRRPELGLSRDLANYLGVGSIALSLLEYWHDENLMALALGHWLVYLQLIEMFLPKTVEKDWFLFLVGLVQVLVGAFLGNGDVIGIVLVAWALTALWTLGLFYLRRESERDVVGQGATVSAVENFESTAPRRRPRPEPAPGGDDPYPGLVDRPFVFSSFRYAGTTLLLGGVIFLLMPRWGDNLGNRRTGGTTKHLTGFSDEVRLGQMGEILENSAVVMSIETYDARDRRIMPDPEAHWRGVAMETYEDGRWLRRIKVDDLDISRPSSPPGNWPANRIRQQIKLEPTDSPALFGLRPFLAATGRFVRLNVNDGMIFRGRVVSNGAAIDYETISAADLPYQPYEKVPDRDTLLKLRSVPEPLKTRLWSMVEPLVADIPADRVEERAKKLEWYLKDSGQFSYSLRMNVVDRSLDPVEDFLVNRKQGHCEYFASALTLMLRSIGIPTRMVNGFKGGDWNDLGQVTTVRQKHAHSWAEALVGEGPNGEPLWMVFDPTPAQQRDEIVAQVGGLSTRLLPLSDYIRYLWVFYIAGFNSDRQERVIYGPIRALWKEALRGFSMMGQALRVGLKWLLGFNSVGEFFSVRGFFVSIVLMGLIVVTVRAILWLDRRLGGRWRRRRADLGEAASGVAAYRRLVQLLAAEGLERPPAETPREFAGRAADALALRGPQALACADVPRQVVGAFYQIRFGHVPPSENVLAWLDLRLDELEAALRPDRAARG